MTLAVSNGTVHGVCMLAESMRIEKRRQGGRREREHAVQ